MNFLRILLLSLACMFALAIQPLAAATKTVSVALRGGAVDGSQDTLRFKKGDEVTIRWSSDRLVELHLHGYDITVQVQPGKIAEMHLKAAIAGRFAVNGHGGHGQGKAGPAGKSLKLGHGERAVAYIEIHP